MVALRSVSCQISDGDMRGTCLVSKTLLLGASDRVCGRRMLEPGLDHGGANGAEGVRNFGRLSALRTTSRRLAKSHALPHDPSQTIGIAHSSMSGRAEEGGHGDL